MIAGKGGHFCSYVPKFNIQTYRCNEMSNTRSGGKLFTSNIFEFRMMVVSREKNKIYWKYCYGLAGILKLNKSLTFVEF